MTTTTTTTLYLPSMRTRAMSSASRANSSLLVVESLQQSWRRRRRRRPNFRRRKDEHVDVVVRATKRETQNQNEGGEAALLDQTSINGGVKDDEGTKTGSLRRQSSTEDMFALYCEKHVELVANALGNDAKCMLYLTEERSGGGL